MYRFPPNTTGQSSWHPWPSAAGNYQPNFNTQWKWWMTCPKCNGLVQYGNKYCPSCGAQMGIEEKPTIEIVNEKLDEILELLRERE